MELKVLDKDFAVCKIDTIDKVNFTDTYFFLSKTDEEISLVCEESSIPDNCIGCEKGWKAFKIEGILDFSLIGILSKISTLLAKHNISIFAISTFNTDYILVKKEDFESAVQTFKNHNYNIT